MLHRSTRALPLASVDEALLPVQIYNTTVTSLGGASDLNYTSPLLHTVEISGLTPGQQYFYTVGDGQNSSAVFNFTALQAPGALPCTLPQLPYITSAALCWTWHWHSSCPSSNAWMPG